MKYASVFSHIATKLVAAIVLVSLTTNIWADNYYFTASAQGGEGGNVYISTQNELSSMGLFSLDANHGKSTFPFDFAQYKLNDVTYGYMLPEMYYQFGSLWYCYSSTSVECTTPMEQILGDELVLISAHDLANLYFDDNGYLRAIPMFYIFTHANNGYVCTGVTAPAGYAHSLDLIEDGSYHVYLGVDKLNGWNAAPSFDDAASDGSLCNVGTFTAQFAKSHVTGLQSSLLSTNSGNPTSMVSSTMDVDMVFSATNFTDKEDFITSGMPEDVVATADPEMGTITYHFTFSATGVNGTHSKVITIKGAAEDDADKQTVTVYWSENNIARDAMILPLHFETEAEFNMITYSKGSGISYGGPNTVNYDGVGGSTWKIQFTGQPGEIHFTASSNAASTWGVSEGSSSTCSDVIMSAGNISGEYTHTLKSSSRFVCIDFAAGAVSTISNVSISTFGGFVMDVDGVALPLQETPAQKIINIVAVDNSLLTVSCTDADFACNLVKDPNGQNATLTITNNAKTVKSATITISNGTQTNTMPVLSYIPPIALPVDLTNNEDSYLYYKLVSESRFISWNTVARSLTFEVSNGNEARYAVFQFDGAPETLYFSYDPTKFNGELSVKYSANGYSWQDADVNTESTSGPKTEMSVELPLDARYIRLECSNAVWSQTATIEQIQITSGVPQGTGAFRIGKSYFTTLEDALAYANNHKTETLTILTLEDYTLPAGNYTLPANATLLVPCCAEQTEPMGTTTVALDNYTVPSAYRTLTFADGVNLNVYGTIEVSSRIYSAQPELSAPCGTYGQLVMNTGSRVTLNSGAFLLVYGFATGNGEIIVNNGADTQELFQVMDWKGGVASATVAGLYGDNPEETLAKKIFIVNQYYLQSNEVPTTYRAGSHAYGLLNVQVYGEIKIDTRVMVIGLTGENAMFKMDEDKATDKNVWVRKRYDAANDRQVYEINSSAYLGSMVIDAMGFAFNSADYVLPITSNFNIHVLSGTMGITENTLLLPGATIEVDKEATAYIDEGKSLYVCGKNNWGKYVFTRSGYAYGTRVRYTPDWGTSCPRACTTLDDLGDATINVHGTFEVIGKLLTSESGANIFSTNADAGTIMFYNAGITTSETVWQVTSNTPTFESFTCVPAILRNGDNTTASISGAAEGTSYCYYDNRWRTMFVDEDNPAFVYDNYLTYYAKPSDYVAIQLTKTAGEFIGNDDHTFSSLDGQRLFILRDADSQWWEVTIQNNYYYCAKNGKYYYYDEDEEDWMEKTFTVTWKNFDGTTLKMSEDPVVYAEYHVVYGTLPEYLGSTPTREATADYTYDFIGWTPDIAPVTGDVVYTAKYQETQRKYTIIFLNENGGEIERHFYALGDMPECENVPTKADLEKSYTLIWEPAIGAVNGDQTYRATFLENAPTEYTIRFVNYDGTELQSSSVAVNTMPAYTGQTPTKPSTFDDDFTFSGWSPALKPVDGAITYTATFTKTKKTYAIRFFESDGTTQIGATQTLEVGATPQVPVYTHAPQAGHTFTLYWTPAVGTVTGAQDYVGRFTDEISRYAVTLVAPHATVAGAGVYDYDEDPEAVSITLTPDENYTFVHWLNENGVIVSTSPSFTTSVTANRTFTAVLNGPVTYTVAYKGNGASTGATMSSRHICGVAQNLTANGFSKVGYTFAGWNTAADGSGTSFTDGQSVLDLSLVQESTVTLYAQWTPLTNIAYTVQYFRENANGTYPDNPYESVAKSDGTADAQKTITPEKSYTGYDTPAAQSVTIAANGTTIVKFYYARATVVVVAYTVKHYQQNLTDDLYTLQETENLQANANSSVTPATKVYEGFTAPATKTVTVAENGSTVVEYQYVRKTYTITFKNANGTTLQSTAFKHGVTPVYNGQVPTKAATAEYTYTFSTWSPAVAVATAAATYTATFTQAANSYTISWVTDGDPLTGNYTNGLTAYGTTIVAPVPTKTGYTFAGWNPALPSSMPAEDVTYTATWTAAGNTAYTVKHYQQNLNDDQYTLIDTDNLVGETGAQVTPAVKSYVGFTAPATQTKTITADGQLLIEYYYTRSTYTITFKDGNNAVLQTSQVKYGATPQYEGTAPRKAASAEYSYTWTGAWTPAIEPATAAATYTATFTQTANTYTITWITDGDALTGNYTTGSVAYGTKIVQPNMPTKAGATFAGWTPSVPGTMPAADISFTATFVTSDVVYYVRYNAPGATGSMPVSSHVLGAPSRLNKNTFVRTGYVFLGWTTGRTAGVEYADEAEITDLTTVPNAIVQLYACWSFEAAVLYDAPTAGQTLQQAADALQMQLTNLRQSCEDNPDLRCDVTIHRTLCHDGSLQPICLPFSVAAVDINDPSNPLYQAAIYSYDFRVKTVSSTVDVMIRRVNHIIAGVPYLIKFQSGSDQQKLEFHGVRFTADNALIEESAPMNYVGALLPEAKVSSQNVLYVGDNNQLEWWNGEGETYLRGFRGFFQLNASGQRSIRRGMVVNLIEQEDDAQKETPTGMDENQNQNEEVKKVIIDNQLYIIRRGTYYNALGTPVYMEIIMDM